jgi:hypothetical protein
MITVVGYSDWEQIYEGDRLLVEGHSVSAVDLLRAWNLPHEQIDMSTLTNEDYEIDNLAMDHDLEAIKKRKAQG